MDWGKDGNEEDECDSDHLDYFERRIEDEVVAEKAKHDGKVANQAEESRVALLES